MEMEDKTFFERCRQFHIMNWEWKANQPKQLFESDHRSQWTIELPYDPGSSGLTDFFHKACSQIEQVMSVLDYPTPADAPLRYSVIQQNQLLKYLVEMHMWRLQEPQLVPVAYRVLPIWQTLSQRLAHFQFFLALLCLMLRQPDALDKTYLRSRLTSALDSDFHMTAMGWHLLTRKIEEEQDWTKTITSSVKNWMKPASALNRRLGQFVEEMKQIQYECLSLPTFVYAEKPTDLDEDLRKSGALFCAIL